MKQNEIYLKKGKEQAVKRFHPWIFSGAVQSKPATLAAGDYVRVFSHDGSLLGSGFYENDSIAVKMFSFEDRLPDEMFFTERISNALQLRKLLGLTENPNTNAYRLIHSEGDGLPGLVVDIYGTTAVMQAQTTGMSKQRQTIASCLIKVMDGKVNAVYDKGGSFSAKVSSDREADAYLEGKAAEAVITENEARFKVDWETGQKTGFFLDQRDNRLLLRQYASGRKVLNAFSYTGGFSVFGLLGGAKHMVSVDSSKAAIALCDENIALNGFGNNRHQGLCQDVKQHLSGLTGNEYDLIVLDPPAFAKNHHNRHKGSLGYKYINSEAIKKIASGGILFTFSCSQAIDRDAFQGIVMAAAIEAGRTVRVLHQLSQPADHPVSIFHPEGAYLKGLVLEIA